MTPHSRNRGGRSGGGIRRNFTCDFHSYTQFLFVASALSSRVQPGDHGFLAFRSRLMESAESGRPFMTSTQLRPTRRTIVRGAAWTVPVVSIAAAAPAFAASLCSPDPQVLHARLGHHRRELPVCRPCPSRRLDTRPTSAPRRSTGLRTRRPWSSPSRARWSVPAPLRGARLEHRRCRPTPTSATSAPTPQVASTSPTCRHRRRSCNQRQERSRSASTVTSPA